MANSKPTFCTHGITPPEDCVLCYFANKPTSPAGAPQVDPWKNVAEAEGWWGDEESVVYKADEVDAARAALEARHAEEMAAEVAVWKAANARAEAASVRAEKAEAELATLREQLAAAQQFKERVAAALFVENPDGPVSDETIIEAADATMTQLQEALSTPSTPEPSPTTVKKPKL